MTIATVGDFATLANLATIASTFIGIYAVVARGLTRMRGKRRDHWLSKGEAQVIALLVAANFATVVALVLISFDNHALIVQHAGDVSAFNKAAGVVEHTGSTISRLLSRILKLLGSSA